MALLNELLVRTRELARVGADNPEIKRLIIDSRKVEQGDLFIARKGTAVDGHDFIADAVDKGAVAVICETMPDSTVDGVVYVRVADPVIETGNLAGVFYDDPSRSLDLIGITGTNGKTTVATICYQLMRGLGFKCGLISTVECRIEDEVISSTHTTPDIIQSNELLRRMADVGCTHVFMEVSSHSLDQQRVFGLRFRGGVFTNITHEHLDYHKTFRAYMEAKKRLFDLLGEDAVAIVNSDSKHGAYMVQNTKARIIRYGLRSAGEIKGRIIENSKEGLHLDVNGREVYCFMKGTYNASNLLAAYGIAREYIDEPAVVLEQLSSVTGAEGRFDIIWGSSRKVMAIVDYAHTPDALEQVLDTIRQFPAASLNRVITIIGCGGNKDKTKRPLMARAVALKSDIAVFTEDNPRSEDPQEIIEDMKLGLLDESGKKLEAVKHCEIYEIIDRAQAIKIACHLSEPGDVILVAGKGHEKYQDKMGTKVPFDDKKELAVYLP